MPDRDRTRGGPVRLVDPSSSLAASAPLALFLADGGGRIVSANAQFGRLVEQCLRRRPLADWLSLIHPADRPRVTERWHESVLAARPFLEEFRVGSESRVESWMLARGEPLSTGEAGSIGFSVSLEDVSARICYQRALAASRSLLKLVIDGIPVLLAYVGSDLRFRFANARCSGWFGLEPGEMPGRDLLTTLGEARFAALRPMIERALQGQTVDYEEELTSADGRRAVLRIVHLPHRLPDGAIDGFMVIGDDVTEGRRREGELRRARRLESLGRLAGGIAHDFNNILRAIVSHVELAERETVSDGAATHLGGIRDGAERGTRLVRELLAFGRRQVLTPRRIDLAAHVEQTLEMVRLIVGEKVIVDGRPGAVPGPVVGDPAQLEQVLVNLCVNARDSMPRGGRIEVETCGMIADSRFCAEHAWARPGRYALLTVRDTGHGMSAEALEHVFDPFFTTRSSGRGTGLGLAAVYGIVRQHRGMVLVASRPGEGCRFSVYLPCAGESGE